MWRLALVLCGLISFPALGSDDEMVVLARCGDSAGHAFYFEGGLTPPGQGGWTADGITGGRIMIYLKGNALNIIMKDSAGLFSYVSDGHTVEFLSLNAEERTFLVQAQNRGKTVIETFLVKLDQMGSGTLIWSGHKIGAPYTKGTLMMARCGPEYAIR